MLPNPLIGPIIVLLVVELRLVQLVPIGSSGAEVDEFPLPHAVRAKRLELSRANLNECIVIEVFPLENPRCLALSS